MKDGLFKTIWFLLFYFLLTPGFSQAITEKLNSFEELKTFSGVEVIFVPSEENRIKITGHSKEKVKYTVIDNRLEVRLSLDNLWSDDNTLITVYGSAVNTIDVNEGSSVEVQDILKGNQIELRAQEGASIISEIESKKLKGKAISGGSVSVRGKTKEQVLEVNTGGQFYGGRLRSESATIKVSTAGRAEVFATQYCKATASLGGVVVVEGNPPQLDTKTSLGGKVL